LSLSCGGVLLLGRSDGDARFRAQLDPRGEDRLLLVFRGVLGLGVNPTTRMVMEALRLRVQPVNDRGWGDLRYMLEDGLFGTVTFLCADFEASVLRPDTSGD
jgi:hypothetical protein